MAGLLRAYPELREDSALTDEQVGYSAIPSKTTTNKSQKAHEILVAVYQLHSNNHTIDEARDYNRIERGTLGLFALYNLTTWELMREIHGISVEDIHKFYDNANKGGRARGEFVRWATEKILTPRIEKQISRGTWARRVLRDFQGVAMELQRATTEIDNEILSSGLEGAEDFRFQVLLGLLKQCLRYTADNLSANADNKCRIGVDELVLIANDIDVAYCLELDTNLRSEYLTMRNKDEKRHICFQHIADLVIKRIEEKGHPILLDNAVRVMLKVIPKLDALTLRDVRHQDWCSILKDHGLDAEAEAFDAAMGDNLSASGAKTTKNERSASIQGSNYMPSVSEYGSTYLLSTRIRTTRPQQAERAADDDDEEGSDASTVRGSVKSAYSSSAASVEAKPVKSKFNSSGVPVYPKHSVAWELMQGNMRPSIVEHIRAESYPPRPSWMGPDLNFQGASSTKTGRQSTRRVISDSNVGASRSKEAALPSQQSLGGIGSAHISKEPATPEKRNKAGTETPVDDNVEETEDSGEQTTPTQASYKQAELAKSSLVSATPQRHLLKSVDSAVVKHELAHDNKTKVSTANTSNAMYIVKEMSAQESAHLDSWINVHKEYYGWYRPLIIDHNIKLTLKNDQRKAFLEELANAEREGRPAFGKELSAASVRPSARTCVRACGLTSRLSERLLILGG
jgi:hypothetical protein